MNTDLTISKHILPTSTTMVGVCMTVISILKISTYGDKSWSDEILAIDSFYVKCSTFLYFNPQSEGKDRV